MYQSWAISVYRETLSIRRSLHSHMFGIAKHPKKKPRTGLLTMQHVARLSSKTLVRACISVLRTMLDQPTSNWKRIHKFTRCCKRCSVRSSRRSHHESSGAKDPLAQIWPPILCIETASVDSVLVFHTHKLAKIKCNLFDCSELLAFYSQCVVRYTGTAH